MCNVVTAPLKEGWSHRWSHRFSLWDGIGRWSVTLSFTRRSILVWCWWVSAWCRGARGGGGRGGYGVQGVVEGNCCFVVIERFLEGHGEPEFVVEGV